MDIPNPSSLLRDSGLSAKKSWGQNFLHDQSVLSAICDATEASPDLPVLELGAGLGALTWHLLKKGGKVVAIERDRELVPLLRDHFAEVSTFEIVEADAAKVDYGEWRKTFNEPYVVAGNLPYQLSSRILVSMADEAPAIHHAVVLVQREVGERMAAEPGSRTYGLLSVLIQRSLTAKIIKKVPPGAFHPAPKVHSAVVRLDVLPQSRSPEEDKNLVSAARAAFSQRRKTLRNSVAGGLGLKPAKLEKIWDVANIAPGERAENLSVEDFARLGAALKEGGFF